MPTRFRPVDPEEKVRAAFDALRENDRMFIGIDPGLTGAVAFLSTNRKTAPIVLDLPILTAQVNSSRKGKRVKSNRSAYDWPAVCRMFDAAIDHRDQVVIGLERGQPRPEDTAKTAFSVGMSTFMWHLYFTAFGLSFEEIAPMAWKRNMKLLNAEKDASRMMAMRVFPVAAHYFACVSDHNRAEALLLATYVQRLRDGQIKQG